MYSLPEKQQQVIEKYLHMQVGTWTFVCPYFMNERGLRNLPIVYSGKGSPEEIEAEMRVIYECKKRNVDDKNDLINLMTLCGIGVDCSGFVVNVLGISEKINYPNIMSRLRSVLRPRTNISADLLTSDLNSTIVSLNDVRPGDLIRRSKNHVMLVEWVDGKKIGYVGSATRPKWGVQSGEIEVTNDNKPLVEQKWSVKYDLEKFVAGKGEVRRLKNGLA